MFDGKIGDSGSLDLEKSPITTNATANDDEPETESKWKAFGSKLLSFVSLSMPLFTWNDIQFKLHGFVVAMVCVDLVVYGILNFSFLSIVFVLFRNALWFLIILMMIFLRLKLFCVVPSSSSTETCDDFEDVERESEISLGSPTVSSNLRIDENEDCIQIKSAIITYLGATMTLKQMTQRIPLQIQYFAFPFVFHAVMASAFWVVAMISHEHQAISQGFWIWLRNVNAYAMVMCLLPVPGFDGAALLTFFLKSRHWHKMAISALMIVVSAMVVVVCSVVGVMKIDFVALYLAVYCGLKLLQYVFNPKDTNMKIFRSLAKSVSNAKAATPNDDIAL